MGIRRGPDGVPMHAPEPPRPTDATPAAAIGPGTAEETDTMPNTVPVERADWNVPRDAGDGHTRVYRPGGSAPSSGEVEEAAGGSMADPPAGWLVIVDGPGKGRAVALGLHHNPIGRDETNRVALDHGDETISRHRHLIVTYDPEGRRFYVTPGDGTNLCYVNDEPVLASMPLEPCAQIRTGRTTLRFVPLCGPDFSWDTAGGVSTVGEDA